MSSIPTPSPYMGVVTDAIKESKQLKEAQFFVLPAPSTCRACRVGERLRFIPLTICNVDRLGIENWQSPPYLDVAQVAIGNYMIDSWYKMGLYHFATPTLVICNASRSQTMFVSEESSGPNPTPGARFRPNSGDVRKWARRVAFSERGAQGELEIFICSRPLGRSWSQFFWRCNQAQDSVGNRRYFYD